MTEVHQHTPVQSSISLTEAAKKRVLTCIAEDSQRQGLRLSVKKTGCSGLAYVLDYVAAPMTDDISLPLAEDYLIYIDKKSLPFLNGLKIDYVKQGLNHKFVFVNPNQTGQCGCGESFTVE